MDRKEDEVAPPQKQAYEAPQITEWGTVADLTRLGKTTDLGDAKQGSNLVPGQ